MSGKIRGKDLSYDSSLPPFLQRLHDQNAGRADSDRHERAIARPKRAKEANDEDEPTVVDESGETLSKDQVARMTGNLTEPDGEQNISGKLEGDGEPKASGALPAHEHAGKRTEHKVTDGTAFKKRKAAKVVETEEEPVSNEKPQRQNSSKPTKKAKKAKPIRLAFDEDNGE